MDNLISEIFVQHGMKLAPSIGLTLGEEGGLIYKAKISVPLY